MLSHTGKIGRLPADIRYQLNHRLLDNESGTRLLIWLNSLPEVQLVLEHHFGGRPINQQNLSAWRTGGYSLWRYKHEMLITAIEAEFMRTNGTSAKHRLAQRNSRLRQIFGLPAESELPGEGRDLSTVASAKAEEGAVSPVTCESSNRTQAEHRLAQGNSSFEQNVCTSDTSLAPSGVRAS